MRNFKRRVLLVSLLSVLGMGTTPQAATGDSVFTGISVHTVNFVFSQPWATVHNTLIANKEAEIYIPARLEINCEGGLTSPGCRVMDSVGVRYKGNSTFSSGGQKRPFRISFDEYGIDQRWDGIKGFTLNNSWNDASHMAEKIHMDFAVVRAGMPGPRMAYAVVKVNGEAHSFYMMGELGDKRLLQNHFNEKDGDLFKAIDGLSNNSDFTTTSFTNQRYENKSDSLARGWTRLGQVITAVNGANPVQTMPSLINMNSIYRGFGADILFASMDSYIGVGQNYLVYFPEAAGSKMEWILWDASLSFGKMTALGGGGGGGGSSTTPGAACTNTATTSIVCGPSSKPLANKIMTNAALREDYLRSLWFLYKGHFEGPWLSARIDSVATVIRPYLTADTKKLSTIQQFETDVTNLKTFVSNRQTSVASQFATLGVTAETAVRSGDIVLNEVDPAGWLELYNRTSYSIDLSGLGLTDGSITPVKYTFPAGSLVASGGRLSVRLGTAGGQAPLTVSTSGGHVRLVRASGSVVDSLTYGTLGAAQSASRIPDGTGAFAIAAATPGAANSASVGASTGLAAKAVVINEFMADNDSVLGPLGTAEDWVELYNTTSQPVSFNGMFLSDNATNPSKWAFPDSITIPAGGYLLVWTDGQTSAGAVHATWSLSKGGEHIRLSNADSSIVDSVTFGAQTLNRSSARIPNGTGAFVLSTPTPNATNDTATTGVRGRAALAGTFGLRQGSGGGTVARFTLTSRENVRLSVLDARGREVALLHEGMLEAGAHEAHLDGNKLPAGLYYFSLRAGSVRHIRTGVITR